MNPIDDFISWIAPVQGLKRKQARRAMAYYEGAKPNPQRKKRTDNTSPNNLVQASTATVRAHARFLERNHDICAGTLRTLVNSFVGPNGIGVEPQPRRKDGTIHKEYAAALREAHRKWRKRPEVTGKHTDALAQRMMAYTWMRDGEAFGQQLFGAVPFLEHGSDVPFSLELFEPDFVPLEYHDEGRRIRQGIQTNAWNRPTNYYVYKSDPRESGSWLSAADVKAISADRMLHLATFTRLHQMRGVSEFASVLTRIEDLKDYEESERIAAKVAASLTAYVKRAAPADVGYEASANEDANGNPRARDLRLQPGMIIDSLVAGEEIGMIDANRPNPNLVGWRAGQLRAFAAGMGVSYSSIAKDYNGSYSAQRQELVEQWIHYAVLTDEFVGMYVEPNWQRFVAMAHLSGVVRMPVDLLPGSEDDAVYIGQSMPWIDPLKETLAYEKQAQAGFVSEPEIIRRRGGNPRDTMEQISAWRQDAAERGLVFSSDARSVQAFTQKKAEPNDADKKPQEPDEPELAE